MEEEVFSPVIARVESIAPEEWTAAQGWATHTHYKYSTFAQSK